MDRHHRMTTEGGHATSIALVAALGCLALVGSLNLAYGRIADRESATERSLNQYMYARRSEQCGVVLTHALARWHSTKANIDDVIAQCPEEVFTRPGMTVKELQRLLLAYGLTSRVVEGDFEKTVLAPLDKGRCVVVPDLDEKHLTACFAIDRENNTLLWVNPPRRVGWVSAKSVEKSFAGASIVVFPKSRSGGMRSPKAVMAYVAGILLLAAFLLTFRHKRRFKACAMSVMICATLGLQAVASASDSVAASGLVLKDDVAIFVCDFGSVDPGGVHKRTFALTNPFKTEFEVSRTVESCSCLDFEVSSKKLPSNCTFTVTVELETDAKGAGALEQKCMLVDSRDPLRVIVLRLLAQLPKDERLRASVQEAMFGRIASDQRSRLFFAVERLDASSVQFMILPRIRTSH